MPTLAERIQAALERHTAEVASILASASMAEVIAFTQSKGAVASAAAPPEPAEPPDDKDPDDETPATRLKESEPKPAPPPKWAVRRAEDERLALGAIKLLAQNGGSAPVSTVVKATCPKNMSVRDFSRRVTTFRKHKGEVICRTRAGIFIVFDLTGAGKQWLDELGIPIEQAGSDTVSGRSWDRARLVEDAARFLDGIGGSATAAMISEVVKPAGMTAQQLGSILGTSSYKGDFVFSRGTRDDMTTYTLTESGRNFLASRNSVRAMVVDMLQGVPDPGLTQEEMESRGLKIPRETITSLMLQGVVRVKGIHGVDYISLAETEEGDGDKNVAKETADSAEMGVMRERMQKINEWLKDHPWSTRKQICDGVGVTYAQLSALDRGDKSRSITREWTGSMEVKKVRGPSGHLVKLYAVRGTDERAGDAGYGSQGALRDRMNAALAWLAMNPGSTYQQIADGIGTSQKDLLNSINVVKTNRSKWRERVEVTGDDLRYNGVARTYRVKA